METQYISLNMTPSGVNPIFHISQYDVGRLLGFYVYNGSEVVDLDDYTCTVEATRTDGTQITTNVITNNNSGIFAVTATMSNVADKYNCQLVIVDRNTNRVASLPFIMDVVTAALNGNDSSIYNDRTLYQQYNASMQAALANEANNRINADNLEKATRQSAVNTLQNNINAEATARQTADTTLQNNIDAEASTRAAQDGLLQSQIDQIIAPSGEAPSAAEVQNARIGADGVIYDTLGNAIRGQVNDLKSAFNEIVASESSNLFNKEDVSTGGYYAGHVNGVIYGDQNDWVTNSSFQDSGLIPYDKTKIYATNISNHSSFFLRFWNSDKKYVGMRSPSEITWNGNVFTPSTMSAIASYISITMSIDENIDTLMVCENQVPESYEPYKYIIKVVEKKEYDPKITQIDSDIAEIQNVINSFIKGEDPTSGKKLGCLGDSITYGAGGTSWVTRMAELCGFSSVINYGVSGTCISDVVQDGHSFIERYPDMADDLDYLTIWGGVNDILYRGATAQEFKQKYEELIEGIREKLPYCKILILTPMKFDVTGTQGARTNKWNEARLQDGNMPVDYVNAEIEIAEKYCIKFINMWTSSGIFIDMQKTQLMPDGIHPNTKCNLEYLAPLIAEALKSF